ncbi:MAG: hypothetical protein GKS06_11895 [Acidobacteria bacterium]|nr:hypothetical protein [Acidobacteriota bacterium]
MRRLTTAITLLALVAVAIPAVAQDMDDVEIVRATNPTFAWGAKQDQQATYTWNSTLSNPSSREAMVNVSLQLLDNSGGVVASDTKMITIAGESEMSVGGEAMLPYPDARSAEKYRIVVEEAGQGS